MLIRNVTKIVLREAVALTVARQTSETIVEHTDVDEDSIMLRLGCVAVGEVVATKAEPHTSKAVDKVADWIASKRNKKTETPVV